MDPAPGPHKPKVRPNIAFARVNTASFRGERGDATLRIPQDLVIKPGAQLAEGCFIGKELGRGIQGVVYELLNERSEPMSLVLKALPHGRVSAVTGVLPSMEREWAVGHRLALYCTSTSGEIHPGFMKVGAALIVESPRTESTSKRIRRQLHMPQAKKDVDRPGSQRRRNGKFRGMVLERLGGRTLDAELAARRSGLQDVHFIREVLFQVLTALAAAQSLGFRHWDLRLKNIMEHTGPDHYRTYPMAQDAVRHSSASVDTPLSRSAGPNGSSDMSYASTASVDSGPDEMAEIPELGGLEVDGKENAHAGPEDEWTDIQLQASGDLNKVLEQAPAPPKRLMLKKKLGASTKTKAKAPPGGQKSEAAPAGGAQSSLQPKAPAPRYKIIDYGHADFGDATLRDDGMAMEGPYFDPQDGLPKWMLKKGLPGIPPAERGYRAFWWRKGDVFRLLMSLQNVLDGCTWPRQDERAVQQLQGFIHHVTGKKIEAYFTDTDGTDKVAMSCGPGAWRRSNGWLHGARKAVVRAQSFVIPYNPGITATEALALPFFTPKHAEAQ